MDMYYIHKRSVSMRISDDMISIKIFPIFVATKLSIFTIHQDIQQTNYPNIQHNKIIQISTKKDIQSSKYPQQKAIQISERYPIIQISTTKRYPNI